MLMLPVLESKRLIILPWIPEVDAAQEFAISGNSNISSSMNCECFDEFDGKTGFWAIRSEEHTSELQSQFRISYAVFCLKKKKNK